jgi:uroporphyrinogen decarboxylase
MGTATSPTFTALGRVLASLGFKEADRVPFFLLLTTHGARETGLSIREYFADPEAVAEGQWRMQRRYGHDCLYGFEYAAIETEAWGGQVEFVEDGPPNAASLIIAQAAEIDSLEAPAVGDAGCLQGNLRAIRLMKEKAGDALPIIGVVMSPFSVPIMQMGFAAYLDLLHDDRERFWRLMALNQEFCARWANAQLEAGATAICYFDPLASTDMVPRELYLETGHRVARETIGAIKGPTATHLASGRGLGLIDDLAATKTAIIGLSRLDDLAEAKKACAGKLTILGNLNGIQMRHWTGEDCEREVKSAIAAAGRGGGFILSDNHGEIHFSVPETVLDAIAAAVRRWGRYPLEWLG